MGFLNLQKMFYLHLPETQGAARFVLGIFLIPKNPGLPNDLQCRTFFKINKNKTCIGVDGEIAEGVKQAVADKSLQLF